MPKGPKGQKRRADVIGNAVKVMRVARGVEPEDFGADDGKDPAARSLGQRLVSQFEFPGSGLSAYLLHFRPENQ